ncbi:MAG TPA: glycosyltransferase family 39 protein [Phycisphaerales bacterium]|nr:glycosyltransferase family 39 protein [Phycisphaerales bacterium]
MAVRTDGLGMTRFAGLAGLWNSRGGAAASWRLGGVALTLLWAAVYLPGLARLPPVDRDEPRFAQASRQMFESLALPPSERDPARHAGSWAVPMFQDQPRLTKPPLVYWLQAGSAALCTAGRPQRDALWMYRLPSALAALGTILVTWRLGVRLFDPRAAWLGALLLALAPVVLVDAHLARADQVLLFCVAAGQHALWCLYAGRGRRGAVVIFWLALAAGTLAKGPVAPMITFLTLAGLRLASGRGGHVRGLRPGLGLALLALCLAPWVVTAARHIGWEALPTLLRREVLERGLASREGHWGPPGYHLVLSAVLLWPGSMVTGLALVRAVRRGFPGRTRVENCDPGIPVERHERVPGRRAELFCLAWIVPSWIVFEFYVTKLPHYTMPLYPPIALLSARALLAAEAGSLRVLPGFVARLGLTAWLGIGLALASNSTSPRSFGRPP